MRIEQPDRAQRLANTILDELMLYNRASLEAGADVSAEVDEGRALFRKRTSPELHQLFEDALRARQPFARYADLQPPGHAPPPGTFGYEPPPGTPTAGHGGRPASASRTLVLLVATIIAIAAGAVGFFMAR